MTLHNLTKPKRIAFECDTCDEELDTEESDFADARMVLLDENWATYKSAAGNWRHKCPACKRGDAGAPRTYKDD